MWTLPQGLSWDSPYWFSCTGPRWVLPRLCPGPSWPSAAAGRHTPQGDPEGPRLSSQSFHSAHSWAPPPGPVGRWWESWLRRAWGQGGQVSAFCMALPQGRLDTCRGCPGHSLDRSSTGLSDLLWKTVVTRLPIHLLGTLKRSHSDNKHLQNTLGFRELSQWSSRQP